MFNNNLLVLKKRSLGSLMFGLGHFGLGKPEAWTIWILFMFLLKPAENCGELHSPLRFVMSNMYTLQGELEAYAQEHSGQYPASLEQLKQKFIFGLYVSDSLPDKNPYNPELPAYGLWQGVRNPGVVYYAPVQTPKGLTQYYIYGTGKTGQPVFDKGTELFLTNQ